MREALERLRQLAEALWKSTSDDDISAEVAEMRDIIAAALSAPPRAATGSLVSTDMRGFVLSIR